MSFFQRLFKKEQKLNNPIDLSVLGCDVHSHLIPAIDDGSKSIEDTLEMLKRFSDFGYKKVITTPHIMSDFYRNTPEIILPKLNQVREAIQQAQLPITIEAAAEYYLDFEFEKKIGQEKLLTFGDNYLLFEVSYVNCPENIDAIIFKMQTNGYKPVLAHPERYPFWYKQFDRYVELRDRGCILQLNINSLTGFYSQETKQIAERMINENLIGFLGSDCHRVDHLNRMQEVLYSPSLLKLIESGNLKNTQLC